MNQKALERGYEKIPVRYYAPGEDGERLIDPERYSEYQPQTLRASPEQWGEYQTYEDGGRLLQGIEDRLQKEYYSDPNNLIDTRQTPVPTGINIFNEGNAGQKSMIDNINSGDYKIVKVNRVEGDDEVHNYEVVDAKTGQSIRGQQVTPVDVANGIFEIPVDDPNSSGYFRNFVSTDPKGFINPIQSEQQSQYTSHTNEGLNFAKNSIMGLLKMAAIAASAGTATPAIAAGEVGSAGLTAAEAANLASSSAFADSAMAGAEGLTQGGALAGAYSTPVPDYSMTVTPNEPLGSFQMGQGTSLSPDAANNPLNPFYNVANPEVSANYNTVSNLVGGGADSNLAALNQLSSNPLIPLGGGGIGGTELGSVGSILGSGKGLGQQTLSQILAPTGLSGVSVQNLASDKPIYSTTPSLSDALKAANTAKNLVKALTPAEQALKNSQATQQQSNLANMLRGAQMPQTALPPIYKQANPFNFGQQNQPVQDVSELAKLLRTA